jgi:hypothetical protein
VARHAEIVGWRRGRSVRSSDSRVVLASAPAETNAGVTNGVALHLVDGHLSSVAVDKLNETAALSRRDLDVCYFAKTLEERAELILGDITREATNEDSGVVGVSELVHLGAWVIIAVAAEALLHTAVPHLGLGHATTHHGVATVMSMRKTVVVVASPVSLVSLWSGSPIGQLTGS